MAWTRQDEGMAIADIDVDAALEAFRRGMGHLRDRRPETYAAA